jgi:DNA polymerase-3 subunit alpha
LLAEDELVIAQGKVQNDRFSGGLRMNVQAVWSLAAARARFGRHLLLGNAGAAGLLHELVQRFPPRDVETEEGGTRKLGLPVRVAVKAEPDGGQVGARWLVELGEASRFWPADEAIAKLGTAAEVIYEAG